MSLPVKLMTHEVIVHTQLQSLERVLEREVLCDITLNVKGIKSHIIFNASEEEINKIRQDLGYTIYVRDGETWETSTL